MEIVHIVLGKANPERMNGVNKVVYQIASRQAASGRDVQVWGITKNITHNYEERNFETKLFKKRKNPFTISAELKNAIIQSENTVFHLHGGWIPTFWAVAKCFKKCNKKSVLTPHGAYNTIAMKASDWTKKIYFQLFEKSILKTANKIHCIGASEKEGLENIYPNHKQIILPYGFDRPPMDSFIKQHNKTFVVGFVGRIDIHTKGLDILTKAFARFQKDKKTKLWIVGDSDENPKLKTMLKEEGIVHNTILYGSKFGLEKNAIIQQMDVFAHPSRNEGLPTAVLEAATFGVPSIVTQATNVGSYITKYNAGKCIKNENVNELITALEEVYLEWQANAMAHYLDNTQAMLNQEFNWDRLINKYDGLYL
ncbi:MAG: glycosyltransferase involved in cell wall biosynthesis [Bacteroidia bacterium]|jgi:glycosyltransferase involved in cell wall biosynthesis